MGRCGEECFSRFVLRLTDNKPRLFGRLVGALIYGLFLGLVTMAHKGFLLYHYYTFLERHNIDPVPQAFLDALPSYVTPAYVIVLLVCLPMILCACCGLGCKVRNLVHWLLALVIGAIVSSLLSYTAQVILYIFRLVTIFLNHKAFLIAMCYCTPRESLYNTTTMSTTFPMTTTQGLMTSSAWASTTSDTTFTIYDENTTDLPFDTTSDGLPFIEDNILTRVTNVWCLCEVPFETFPVGVTSDSPSSIDAEFLRYFGVEEYVGDVNVTVVNSTQLVKDAVDVKLTEYKWFLSLLQGIAVVLALRLPLWIMFSSLWTHVHLMEVKIKLGMDSLNPQRTSTQPSKSEFGVRMACYVSRAGKHIDSRRLSSRQSSLRHSVSLGPDGTEKTDQQIFEAGKQEGIRKGQQLPNPPQTIWPIMEPLFFCLLETLDAFSLLDEIVYRKHFFKVNMAFTYAIVALVGLNLLCTMIINALVSIPRKSRGKGILVCRWLLVFIANVGFLIIRIWLFVRYGAFKQTQVSSVFLLFIGKEFLTIIYELVLFGMEMSNLRIKQTEDQSTEMLGRWRNYTEGMQSDKMDTVWIQMNGAPRGETADDASNSTDNTSIQSARGFDEYPAYNDQNIPFRHVSDQGTVPFQRDYRYFQNDQPVYASSYGVPSPDVIDLVHLKDEDGGFLGPEEIGGFGTFTRRSGSTRRPIRSDTFDEPNQGSLGRQSKYTDDELKNMVFYI